MVLSLGIPDVFPSLGLGHVCLKGILQNWGCVLLSALYQKAQLCPNTDVRLISYSRSCLQGFFTVTIRFLSLQLIKWFVGDTLKLCKYCFSSNLHPLVLASIDDSCLNQLLLWHLQSYDILTSSLLLYRLVGILLWDGALSIPPLFIYSCIFLLWV